MKRKNPIDKLLDKKAKEESLKIDIKTLESVGRFCVLLAKRIRREYNL